LTDWAAVQTLVTELGAGIWIPLEGMIAIEPIDESAA
jgi:hypothetical protein